MKKFSKGMTGLLCAAMIFSATACGSKGENTKPEISGVADRMIEAGSEFRALEGVSASDAEDGDITAKIVIESMPELTFQNGVAVPDKPGNYELIYSVTDKGGLTTEAYATLTVAKQTGEAVVYKEFDFAASQTVDDRGWTARIAEGVDASGELKQGAYVFDITSPGNGDGDIQLVKQGVELKAADYRVRVWIKSTSDTYAHIIARDESVEEWSTFGGVFNAEIGQEVSPVDLLFTSNGEGSAEIMINLGKITPDPNNPSNTTPENFTVTIDKIEIYEISGEETQIPVFTSDFSSSEEGAVVVEAGDGAAAEVSYEEGAALIRIASYPTDGGVWSIKGNVVLQDVSIEEGQKYYYSLRLQGYSAQAGECLVESASLYDGARVHFNSFFVGAGEETVISGTFTADKTVSDPVIRLQIGNPSDGVSENNIRISDVVFGRLEGDLETVKTIDAFCAYGQNTANATNPEQPWMTYNGTDEDNERGVGTIYQENGSLFYRIDQGGTTDWHNKLVCGYTGNPLTLAADSYYTIEITAKATKDVSCGFFLNPLGSWDPRISEGMDITTQEQTFTFETTDTFVLDMDFEMLFQFGSEDTAQLGEVTIEISNIKILQRSVY